MAKSNLKTQVHEGPEMLGKAEAISYTYRSGGQFFLDELGNPVAPPDAPAPDHHPDPAADPDPESSNQKD